MKCSLFFFLSIVSPLLFLSLFLPLSLFCPSPFLSSSIKACRVSFSVFLLLSFFHMSTHVEHCICAHIYCNRLLKFVQFKSSQFFSLLLLLLFSSSRQFLSVSIFTNLVSAEKSSNQLRHFVLNGVSFYYYQSTRHTRYAYATHSSVYTRSKRSGIIIS